MRRPVPEQRSVEEDVDAFLTKIDTTNPDNKITCPFGRQVYNGCETRTINLFVFRFSANKISDSSLLRVT